MNSYDITYVHINGTKHTIRVEKADNPETAALLAEESLSRIFMREFLEKAMFKLHHITLLLKQHKNQVVEVAFKVWLIAGKPSYEVTFYRQHGEPRTYETTHFSSIAFDWLSDCINSRYMWRQSVSLSIYPIFRYYFQERDADE